MIKLENVCFKYKNTSENIIDNINIEINEGEIVTIVGKNGSGKSTIAKLIAGITKIKQGKITIDDLDVSQRKNYKVIQEKIGIVFQNPENQIIFNNIYDELSFSLKNLDKEEIERRINQSLEDVNMIEYKKSDLYSLSLGQKQRIMIAEILAKKPKYLVLDEPTTMLDSEGKEKIYEIINNLKKQGYTIICITNVADEILLADRILILEDGKIVEEIYKKELIEKAYLLDKHGIKQPILLNLLTKLSQQNVKIELKEISISEVVSFLKGKLINEKCN